MSQIKATFSGGVVADPEVKSFDSGAKVKEIAVYVNHQRKDKDTGNYEPTGDTSKIRVKLWNDKADTDIRKGDIVEVVGTLVEKTFQKRDGSEGRQIETDYIESITVKYRRDDGAPAASDNFAPAATSGDGW